MIEKVIIKNYGPFENQKINLVSKREPIFIIGMNDVGKTSLLTAISSLGNMLSGKYFIKEKSEVILRISANYLFEKEFKREWNKIFGVEIYSEEIDIIRNSTTDKDIVNVEFFYRNKKFSNYVKKIIEIINASLSQENKIDYENKNITHDDLEERINNVNKKSAITKKDKNAIEKIKTFIRFKYLIYKSIQKIHFLPAEQNDTFSFIKDKYLLFDTTSSEGKELESDIDSLKKLMNSFIEKEKFESFMKILKSDSSDSARNSKLVTYSREMEDKMNDFFENNFPSENKKVKFNLRVDGEEFYITVKDNSSQEYLPITKRSDGFLWFIKLYTFIFIVSKGDTIVIDEPERFLHATAQVSLVNIFEKIQNEKKVQIIYATHSPFMLSKAIIPNIKIVKKLKKGSAIYNNVNALTNDPKNDFQDALLPVSMALGMPLPYFAKLRDLDNKKILFVEGVADIYTIKISEFLEEQKLKNTFIWPLLGDTKFYAISFAVGMNWKYKILFDGKKRPINDNFPSDKTIFLYDLVGKFDPEDMLLEETKEKYKMNLKNNHKWAWKTLHDDLLNSDFKLSNEETNNIQNYYNKLNEHIKSLDISKNNE